jgi:hypothetical protein
LEKQNRAGIIFLKAVDNHVNNVTAERVYRRENPGQWQEVIVKIFTGPAN